METPLDFQDIRRGNFLRPGFTIHIAADRGDGRDFGQLIENLGITDVPGVDDAVGTFQRGQGFGAKQSVSVRDNADFHAAPEILASDGASRQPF
jgi:hypothetical protein